MIGWTTHHSIVEFRGKWYLFYHDCELSGGINHRRCVKYTELHYNEDGTIQTIFPYDHKKHKKWMLPLNCPQGKIAKENILFYTDY